MTREWTKTRAGTRSKVNMVRYEAVNAMLLNEFLKRTAGSRNRKPAFEMKSTVAKAGSDHCEAAEANRLLTATVKQVNDQLETSNPRRQLVANRP